MRDAHGREEVACLRSLALLVPVVAVTLLVLVLTGLFVRAAAAQ